MTGSFAVDTLPQQIQQRRIAEHETPTVIALVADRIAQRDLLLHSTKTQLSEQIRALRYFANRSRSDNENA